MAGGWRRGVDALGAWFAVGDGPGTLVTVQWLRFLAAGHVVLGHAADKAVGGSREVGAPIAMFAFDGHFGVCVFFVISGFIMMYVSGEKFGRPGAPVAFAWNRILRIVPLYWTITAANLAVLIAGSRTGESRSLPALDEVVRSFLFIPYLNEAGKHRPVLGVGWTLDFEMFFYALFALSLIAPRRLGLPLLIAGMSAFALWPWSTGVVPLDILTDPIILYFVAGMLLAVLRGVWLRRGPLPRIPQAIWICVAGFVAYSIVAALWPSPAWTPVFAVALVALAVLSLDPPVPPRSRAAIVALGASSYSLYLLHPLLLQLGALVWTRFLPIIPPAAFFVLAVAGSVLAGLLCWRALEIPMTAVLKARLGRRRQPA